VNDPLFNVVKDRVDPKHLHTVYSAVFKVTTRDQICAINVLFNTGLYQFCLSIPFSLSVHVHSVRLKF